VPDLNHAVILSGQLPRQKPRMGMYLTDWSKKAAVWGESQHSQRISKPTGISIALKYSHNFSQMSSMGEFWHEYNAISLLPHNSWSADPQDKQLIRSPAEIFIRWCHWILRKDFQNGLNTFKELGWSLSMSNISIWSISAAATYDKRSIVMENRPYPACSGINGNTERWLFTA